MARKKSNLDRPLLKVDPSNYRLHPQRNKDLIRQSLEEVGAFRSIGIDGDNIIRAGNGVYEQAEILGLKVRVIEAEPDELIAVKRSDLKGAKARRAALYDNQSAATSEWDFAKLQDTLEHESEILNGIFQANELAVLNRSTAVADEQIERLSSNYYIIVECSSEDQQLELLERFVSEGLTCRAAS